MTEFFASTNAPRRRGSQSAKKPEVRQNVFRIPSNITVTLGLQWNFIGEEPVDLDASCVAFDKDGNSLEAVFFNHLEAETGYMVHTGDNQTGEDDGDDDEAIVFHMAKVPEEVHYLMVCVTSYTGADFTLVESANVRVLNTSTSEIVGSFSLGVVGRHSASLLCAFSRVTNDNVSFANTSQADASLTWWDMREINIPCFGYSFCDLLPRMMDLLGVPDELRKDRLQSLPEYSLEKNVDIANMELSQLKMGLGWDGENDLDASLVMLDVDGNYVDHVHAKFGKLKSRDNAVLHSGDKLNGYDVAGDDEYIEVNLMSIDKRAHYVYFLALLYEGLADSLAEVPKCYVRMLNKASPNDRNYAELDRININDIQGPPFSALVAFCAKRINDAHWERPLVTIGESMAGRDWIDIFPFTRTFAKLHCDTRLWDEWKRDVFPFAIRVTFGGVRQIGPQEPHQFRCHCHAWVCDRKGRDRFKSQIVNDRDHVQFDESHVFVVDKLSVVRVMVYETAMVGFTDLVMSEFFGSSGAFPEPPNADSPRNQEMQSFSAFQSPRRESEEMGGTGKAEPEDDEEMLLFQHPKAEPSSSANGGKKATTTAARSTIVPEGELICDDWFPLTGVDITGDIHLRVERVTMPEQPATNGGGCCVM